jgi:hypothetical protein
MAKNEKYLELLMKNYPLVTDIPKKKLLKKQTGGSGNGNGNGDETDFPIGGFPPIFNCENAIIIAFEESNKNREYSTHKTSVSISEIMTKRRNNDFFTL